MSQQITLNDAVRLKLSSLASTFGHGFVNDPNLCRTLLRAACADMPKEVSLLLAALDQNVPQDISAGTADEAELARRLTDNLAMAETAARWAVSTWTQALAPNPLAAVTETSSELAAVTETTPVVAAVTETAPVSPQPTSPPADAPVTSFDTLKVLPAGSSQRHQCAQCKADVPDIAAPCPQCGHLPGRPLAGAAKLPQDCPHCGAINLVSPRQVNVLCRRCDKDLNDVSQSLPLNDAARSKLCELISAHGSAIVQDPSKCRSLIRAMCPQHQRETSLLLTALDQDVPQDLATSVATEEDVRWRMIHNLAMSEVAATWAASAWANALKQTEAISDEQLTPPASPQRATTLLNDFYSKLFPPHEPPSREIVCEKCQTSVSDIAELCPKCGHPQPKSKVTTDNPWESCRYCRTFNLINPLRPTELCRGCGRTLEDACPNPFVDYEADQVFGNAARTSGLWGPNSMLAVFLAYWAIFRSAGNGGVFVFALIIASAVAYAVKYIIHYIIYHFGYKEDFRTPSRYADQMRYWKRYEWTLPARRYELRHPKWFVTNILVCGGIAAAIGFGLPLWNTYSEKKAKQEAAEEYAAFAPLRGAMMTANIKLTADYGRTSTDLILVNAAGNTSVPYGDTAGGYKFAFGAKAEPLSQIDFSFVVTYESGEQTTLKRLWDKWDVDEKKTVTLPIRGKLNAVAITGKIRSGDGTIEGTVDRSYTFKSKS